MKKRTQSLSYLFKEEIERVVTGKFDCMFAKDGSRHPEILKTYLRGEISIETMVILDKILGFRQDFDKHLSDPVWETVSMRIKKYILLSYI